MTRMERPDILYPELSYQITGLCYTTQNKLGRFCREKQYGDEIERLLKEKGIPHIRECNLRTFGLRTEGNIVDFLIDGKVLLDIKAKKFVTKEDYYQMLRYLQCSKLTLGLIVNFRSAFVKPKRIINLPKDS